MPYYRVTERKPGCVVLVIDQSSSLDHRIIGTNSQRMCDAIALAANDLLAELLLECISDIKLPPRDKIFIAAIAFGNGVSSAFSGDLNPPHLIPMSELAALVDLSPDGHIKWIDSICAGETKASEAIDLTTALIDDWLINHYHCSPPIVLCLLAEKSLDKAAHDATQRLTARKSYFGKVIQYNLYVPSSDVRITYPQRALGSGYARHLFGLAGRLPEPMRSYMRRKAFDVDDPTEGRFDEDFYDVGPLGVFEIGTLPASPLPRLED